MDNEQIGLFDNEGILEQPKLVGQVANVLFSAQDSFYKVMIVTVAEASFDYDEEEIAVTGSFGDIQIGASYEFKGQLKNHPRYGLQFAADNYQRQSIGTSSGLVAYLASDKFPGVGKATAEKVVDALGVDAIDKILESPEVLKGIGLSTKVQETIAHQLQQSDGMERAIIALNEFGFGAALATAIYQKYQLETMKVLRENPYQLVLDIEGVSFARIDQLARQQGIEPLDARRIQAGVVAALNLATFEAGDTFVTLQELLNDSQRMLERAQNVAIDALLIKRALLTLTNDGVLIAEADRLYMKNLYVAEREIAERLVRLTKIKSSSYLREDVVATLNQVEKENPFPYDEVQQDAMIAALTSQLFILTGGPGTGKTTIVNGVVATYKKLLRAEGMSWDDVANAVLLAAPTGRAAKRLSEATGMPASTIHRLLGITGRESSNDIDIDELEGRLLVVDEMSMVDTELFALLLRAIPNSMQVILVGDKDQLPSVGPGRVFYDLLASGLLNYRELETIHRQGKGSTIIELASAVKSGTLPADFTERQPDRSFFYAHMQDVPQLVEKIATSWRDKKNSVADMQILAPMYKTSAGVHHLNELAQNIFNPMSPKKRELRLKLGDREFAFRVGDKVMQTANDPEHNVFNGDIGYITAILLAKDKANSDNADILTVAFDTGEVDYTRQTFNQLTLAYATTIHKSQGTEYKLVIMPLVGAFSRMLQRNLLYTGLTRAAESLVLLGEPEAYLRAAQTEGVNRRTTLQARLQQAESGNLPQAIDENTRVAVLSDEEEIAQDEEATAREAPITEPSDISADAILTAGLIEKNEIDPNIGMDGLTPYDFV
jgi:exodeoxyribonuclease V alpha subunit